jgi:hypothetical protein
LVNADRDADNACIDLVPTFGAETAAEICVRLGTNSKFIAANNTLMPAAGTQTVFALFAWSSRAQQASAAYVMRLFQANGVNMQLGPVVYL